MLLASIAPHPPALTRGRRGPGRHTVLTSMSALQLPREWGGRIGGVRAERPRGDAHGEMMAEGRMGVAQFVQRRFDRLGDHEARPLGTGRYAAVAPAQPDG